MISYDTANVKYISFSLSGVGWGWWCTPLCIRQHHVVWFWSRSVPHPKWTYRFLPRLIFSVFFFFFSFFSHTTPSVRDTFIIYSYKIYAYAYTKFLRHPFVVSVCSSAMKCVRRRRRRWRPHSLVHPFIWPVWLNDFLAGGNRLCVGVPVRVHKHILSHIYIHLVQMNQSSVQFVVECYNIVSYAIKCMYPYIWIITYEEKCRALTAMSSTHIRM